MFSCEISCSSLISLKAVLLMPDKQSKILKFIINILKISNGFSTKHFIFIPSLASLLFPSLIFKRKNTQILFCFSLSTFSGIVHVLVSIQIRLKGSMIIPQEAPLTHRVATFCLVLDRVKLDATGCIAT